MDKNIIKKHLADKFLSEDSTPGIDMAKKMKKEETKINKDGVKAIVKDVAESEKDAKEDINTKNMPQNKFNYDDDFEKTYHDEMEIMNGQEMLQYDSKPNKEFVEKAKEGIEGSSRMGNAKAANAEASQGASSDNFGKDLVKKIKSSIDKRSAETPTLNLRGRDIQADLKDTGHKPYATDANVKETITPNKQIKESMKRLKFNKDGKNPFQGTDLTQKLGHALTLIPESYRVDNKVFEMTDGNVSCRIRWEGSLTEGRAVVLTAADKKMINEDIEKMKHLFNYKSESTLGLVKGNARLDENAAFADVFAKTKKLLGESEEIEGTTAEVIEPKDSTKPHAAEAKKHVEGSVPKQKDGTVPEPKTVAPADVDTIGKSGKKEKMLDAKEPKEVEPADSAKTVGSLEESENIEGTKAKTVEPDKSSKPHAPEAKKHVEGSVTQKKDGTVAKPTEIAPEDSTKKHAPEAKKHVEGTVKTEKKTEAKKPKEAPFEEAPIAQAAEAKEHIESGKGTKLAKKAPVVKENEEVDNEPDADEPEDNWNKPDVDDTDDEKEPSASDIKSEPVPAIAGDDDDDVAVPAVKQAGGASLLFSPSSGKYFIKRGAGMPEEVPAKYLGIASDKTKLAAKRAELILSKMEEEVPEMSGGEEGEVEEGLFSKSPEQLKQIGMQAINMHPMKKKAYQQFLAQDPAKAEKYVMFVGANPDAKQINWDEKTQNFVNNAVLSVASGEGLAGK